METAATEPPRPLDGPVPFKALGFASQGLGNLVRSPCWRSVAIAVCLYVVDLEEFAAASYEKEKNDRS
jgi:hypothetical protein